jgi:hypothetical protein
MMLDREDEFNLTDRVVIDTDGSYWVECEVCQASTWIVGNVDNAEKQWNKRADSVTVGGPHA